MSDEQKRYFVDERGGCIAVRDRLNTDPDYPGLHPDTTGVVWFQMAERVAGTVCEHCGMQRPGSFDVTDEQRAQAKAKCDELNAALITTLEAELAEADRAAEAAEQEADRRRALLSKAKASQMLDAATR